MKKILLGLCLALSSTIGYAQQSEDNSSKGVFYKDVPKKLYIEDKIFIQNKTPYLIIQSVVALVNPKGELIPLGSTSYLSPNETIEIAEFPDDKLRQLRGRRIAIKIKGSKKFVVPNKTSVNTPSNSDGVHHQDLSPEMLNNIKPEDIFYDFDAILTERSHDLYIQIMCEGQSEKNIMDF